MLFVSVIVISSFRWQHYHAEIVRFARKFYIVKSQMIESHTHYQQYMQLLQMLNCVFYLTCAMCTIIRCSLLCSSTTELLSLNKWNWHWLCQRILILCLFSWLGDTKQFKENLYMKLNQNENLLFVIKVNEHHLNYVNSAVHKNTKINVNEYYCGMT